MNNTAMNFEEFVANVEANIKSYLPEEYAESTVSTLPVFKNNTVLTGLTISSPSSNLCPTIYLNSFYGLEDGEDMDEVMKKIADIRVSNEVPMEFDVNCITDFEKVKSKIYPRVIGETDNWDYLKNLVYTKIDDTDLCIITYIELDGGNLDFAKAGECSVVISKQIANSWDVDTESLIDLAYENAKRENPFNGESMFSALSAAMPDDVNLEDLFMETPNNDMIVVSNQSKYHGAAAIADKDFMKGILEKYGERYILPSSIHEFILVDAAVAMAQNGGDEEMTLRALKDMVEEVNATQVMPVDKLSDHVYKYVDDKLTIVA